MKPRRQLAPLGLRDEGRGIPTLASILSAPVRTFPACHIHHPLTRGGPTDGVRPREGGTPHESGPAAT
jgi:hypothetical protein